MHAPSRSLAALAFAVAAACARAPERPNVLLITVDTLRADRISAAGYPRPTTPCIDALAAEGLLFTRCQSPRAKTTPAIASLMTGLYPHEHGVRDLATPLDARFPLLAESLRDAGYRTGAIVGNYVLGQELSGLARGFDLWVEDLPDLRGVPPDDVPERTARSLTDGALAALGLAPPSDPASAGPHVALAASDEPWFLWLHYMDPHGRYDPPQEHRIFARSVPDPIPPDAGPSAGEVHRRWIATYNVPPEAVAPDGTIDAALVRDLYDGEVHYADHEIGRLIERLRGAGRLAATLVVVTADHGESLGEQQYWFEHGRNASEATCRVPLVVRLPDAWPERPRPGRRGGDISLADLAPSLLEMLGLPAIAPEAGRGSVRGVSRARLFREDSTAPHPVFCEKVERAEISGAIQSKAVRSGGWKLIRRYAHLDRPDGARELVVLGDELYDLARDPGEAASCYADPPADTPLAQLESELLRFALADPHLADLAAELQEHRDAVDPDTARVLEALGY